MDDYNEQLRHPSGLAQALTMFSLGIALISLRMFARTHSVGLSHLEADDYMMLLAAGWYSCLFICLIVITRGGGSNVYVSEEYETFTEQDIKKRIVGAKLSVVSEQAMLNVIYTLKACLLFMYKRITLRTIQYSLITPLAVYVAFGWLATEIAFFTTCRPFQEYWALHPSAQCATLEIYSIVQLFFNVSSDICLLLIPIPMVIQLRMPIKQRIALLMVFGNGIYVTIAAIISKAMKLSNLHSMTNTHWYMIEASVAIYVSNIPLIWPLLRQWVPCLHDSSSTEHNRHGRFSTRRRRLQRRRAPATHSDITLRAFDHSHKSRDDGQESDIEMREQIIGKAQNESPADSTRALT